MADREALEGLAEADTVICRPIVEKMAAWEEMVDQGGMAV